MSDSQKGLTLYSSTRCPWAWLALIETNTPFKLHEIDLAVPRPDWYLKEINPVGKVPALKLPAALGGHVICESAVCTEYLADETCKLLPVNSVARANIRYFVERFVQLFPPAMYSIYSQPEEKQKELLESAVSGVNDLLKLYLKPNDGPFLLGSKAYTLAEVNCAPFLARYAMAGRHGLLPEGIFETLSSGSKYASFNQYMSACLSHPSHVAIWDEETNLAGSKRRLAELKTKI